MEIVPGILLGRRLTTGEAADLLHQGDVAVLDLAPEIAEISVFRGCTYQHVPILDLAPPSIPQLEAAVKFIKSPDHTNKIYIHCSLGLSRSSAVVAAFLLSEGADTDTAISLIRESRPEIIVSGAVQRVLKEFEAKRDSRETQVPLQVGFDNGRPLATVNKQSDPGHLSSAGKYILKVLS